MATTNTATFNTSESLNPELAGALLQFGRSLAETKYALGSRLSEWVTGAPAMEAAVAAAAITQDELGHARSLFAMLREFPGAPDEIKADTYMQTGSLPYSPGILARPFASWFDLIAALYLLDQAITTVIRSARESAYLPLRQRVAKILQEEHFHAIYSKGWVAHIAGQGQAARERMQKALDGIWPASLHWLGPPTDERLQTLVEHDILAELPGALQEQWCNQMESQVKSFRFTLPATRPDWKQWHPKRRELVA